eukprot:4816299-Pleurochrysis_carterae.AAC.3
MARFIPSRSGAYRAALSSSQTPSAQLEIGRKPGVARCAEEVWVEVRRAGLVEQVAPGRRLAGGSIKPLLLAKWAVEAAPSRALRRAIQRPPRMFSDISSSPQAHCLLDCALPADSAPVGGY